MSPLFHESIEMGCIVSSGRPPPARFGLWGVVFRVFPERKGAGDLRACGLSAGAEKSKIRGHIAAVYIIKNIGKA